MAVIVDDRCSSTVVQGGWRWGKQHLSVTKLLNGTNGTKWCQSLR